jgi:hypothetical protein
VKTTGRVPFTDAEESYLREGVQRYQNHGSKWAEILRAYPFHSKRTSVDLKDKWRNISKKEA